MSKARKNMMVHFNGHMPCAIDTETTGLIPGYHHVWQVAFVMLDGDFKINKDYPFFNTLIIPPDDFENYDPKAIDKDQIEMVRRTGMTAEQASDCWLEWYSRLNLPINKRLIPIAQNWCFDKPFLCDWLGNRTVNDFFDAQYGDLIPITRFLNDLMGFQTLQVPFPRYSLGALCNRLGVTNVNPHDALCDAVATAACYRQLIKLNCMFTGVDKSALPEHPLLLEVGPDQPLLLEPPKDEDLV